MSHRVLLGELERDIEAIEGSADLIPEDKYVHIEGILGAAWAIIEAFKAGKNFVWVCRTSGEKDSRSSHLCHGCYRTRHECNGHYLVPVAVKLPKNEILTVQR